MSAYSDLEDSLGATHAWPLDDAGATYADRVGILTLAVTSGSATSQSATIVNGTPTVALNGTLSTAIAAVSSLTAYTLVAWVNIAGNQAGTVPIYIGSGGSDGAGLFIGAHHSGAAGAELQGLMGGVGFVDSAPSSLTFSTTYMLAIRRLAGTTDLLLNGVVVGPGLGTAAGAPSALTSINLVGNIGFVAAFPTGLSTVNIASLYTIGSQVQSTPMALNWVGQDAFLPVLADPLALRWVGQSVVLPTLPTPFPIIGRRALSGTPVLRVSWSGAAANSATGFDSFSIRADTTYTITAQCFDIDGTPQLPNNTMTPDSMFGSMISADLDSGGTFNATFNIVTGVVSFTVPADTLVPGVYACRLFARYPDTPTNQFLFFPTFACVATVTE